MAADSARVPLLNPLRNADGVEVDPAANAALPTTSLQRRKYKTIITTTLALLRERGFDQLKMQDVSSASGIALATIYRYFGSRDCLIYEATYSWGIEIWLAIAESNSFIGPAARLVGITGPFLEEYRKEPQLANAWARANLSADPEVARRVKIRRPEMMRIMASIVGDADQDLVSDLFLIIEQVTATSWARWMLNQQSYEDIARNAQRASLLVLAAHGVIELPGREG